MYISKKHEYLICSRFPPTRSPAQRKAKSYDTFLTTRDQSGAGAERESREPGQEHVGIRSDLPALLFINAQSFTCIQMMFLVGSFNWNLGSRFAFVGRKESEGIWLKTTKNTLSSSFSIESQSFPMPQTSSPSHQLT
jgi:hypothetical protein